MQNVNPTNRLNQAIVKLELQRNDELKLLKEEYHTAYESMKPLNIIKNTLKEITQSPDLKGGLSSAAVDIASGYVVKGILFGATRNPLIKLAGIAVQALATNIAAKNSDKIKTSGVKLFKFLKSASQRKRNTFVESDIYI